MLRPALLTIFSIASFTGCDDEQIVNPDSRVDKAVAVVPSIGGSLLLLRLGRDTTLKPAGSVLRLPSSIERSSVDGQAIMTSFESFSDRSVSRIDLREAREISRVRLSQVESSNSDIDGVNLNFGDAFAASRESDIMAFAQSSRNLSPGVALVNTTTWRLQAFVGPITAYSVAFGRWRNQSVLFIAGARPSAEIRYSPMILIVGADAFRPIDSIPLSEFASSPFSPVFQLHYAAKTRRVIAMASGTIVSCAAIDPVESSCNQIRSPVASGLLSVRDGDDKILLNDGGTRDSQGSGSVYVIASDASTIEKIDLPPENGVPLAIRGVAADSATGTWFISVGSPTLGLNYPAQSPRLLIYDFQRRRVVREFRPNAEILGPSVF